MNYKITFSTFVNSTGQSISKRALQLDLVEIAGRNHIQGFTLTDQTGYWAGELEASHALTLLDTSPAQARKVATELKKHYKQQAVILEQLPETNVEFI